jgi:hypothetical protein
VLFSDFQSLLCRHSLFHSFSHLAIQYILSDFHNCIAVQVNCTVNSHKKQTRLCRSFKDFRSLSNIISLSGIIFPVFRCSTFLVFMKKPFFCFYAFFCIFSHNQLFLYLYVLLHDFLVLIPHFLFCLLFIA